MKILERCISWNWYEALLYVQERGYWLNADHATIKSAPHPKGGRTWVATLYREGTR